MVKAICELTGLTSTYMGMPSAAYQIGSITISRDGSIDCEDEAIFSCNSEVGLLAKQIKATVAELKA